MKRVLKCMLSLALVFAVLLSVPVTSYAIVVDGGGGNDSSAPPGASGGQVNDHYCYYGIKATLCTREDVLAYSDAKSAKGGVVDATGVNPNAYKNALRNRSGIVFLMSADGNIIAQNANYEWSSMRADGSYDNVTNIGLGLENWCTLFQLDQSEFFNQINSVRGSNNSSLISDGMKWSSLTRYLTKKLNSDNSMLYDRSERLKFYRLYKSVMDSQLVPTYISEADFMGKTGVLVIEPVVGVSRGQGVKPNYTGPWFTFQTAEAAVKVDGIRTANYIAGDKIQRVVFGQSTNSSALIGEYPSPLYMMKGAHGSQGRDSTSGAMVIAGSWTNQFDILGEDTSKAHRIPSNEQEVFINRGNNQRHGFLVFGLDKGTGYVDNLALKATQNKDGSFEVESVASRVAQATRDMEVDDNLIKGTTKDNKILGGQSDNGGSIPLKVSNVSETWVKGYETYAYGNFISSSSKVITQQGLEDFRADSEGHINAIATPVDSGDFNDGETFLPDWTYRTPELMAQAYASKSYGGRVTRRIWQRFYGTGGSATNLVYNLMAKANNYSNVNEAELKSSDELTAGQNDADATGAREPGIAVEYFVKYEPIKSFISYAKIKYDEDGRGTLTIGKNDKVDYNKGTEGHFTVDKPYFVITTVSNCKADDNYRLKDDNRDGNSYWDKVEADLQYLNTLDPYVAENRDRVDEIAKKYLDGTAKTSLGTKDGSLVSLGSDDGCGYSVFVLEIEVPPMHPQRIDPPLPPTPEYPDTETPGADPNPLDATTWIDLQDYQLNFIHQNYLDHSWGRLTNMGGEDPVEPNAVTKAYCVVTQNDGHNRWLTRAQKYSVVHNSVSGVTINADKNKPYSFLYYNRANGDAYTFQQMQDGVGDINCNTFKNYTYAWDLSRGIFGDVRTISALSGNAIDDTTRQYMMDKHNHIYGIVPDEEGGAPKSSVIRNSFGTIQNGIADELKYSAQWDVGDKMPQDELRKIHSGKITDADGDKIVEDTMFVLGAKGVSGARPLAWNSIHKYTDDVGSYHLYDITLDVHEIIYKYSTETIATGENTKKDQNLETGKRLSGTDYGYGDDDANLSKDDVPADETDKGIMYRNAVVAGSDFTLRYYPEVRMRAYLAEGDTIDGKGSITPRTIITMAELARTTKPSSMYLMKVDSSKTDGTQQLTGEIYSDTMGAGSNAEEIGKGSKKGRENLPVIYGGSDVTLDMNPEDLNIKLYGYALDLSNYDIDKDGLKYAVDEDGNAVRQPYTNIVNDTGSANRDPYTTWGNDSTESAKKLQDQFNAWVEDIVNSVDADVTLKVSEADSSGNLKDEIAKEFNNFSVAMPTLKADDYKVDATDGVFNIVVKRGDVDRTTTEFKALVNQIAEDYGCSKATAEKLFNESDMYQSIVRSIEDIKDDFNVAQKVNTDEEGAHAVRDDNTDENWYDEEVKVFVVRRYEAEPINIDNVVLTDKIDYDVSPDSTAGNNANDDDAQQSSYDQRIGQWYLSLYIRKPEADDTDFNIHFTDKDHYFNPETETIMKWLESPEADRNKVLINNIYVDGGDFKIPSADTAETLW